MKKLLYISVYILTSLWSNDYPEKRFHQRTVDPLEVMGREDRKYGDHSGNRVLCRIYNHGSIGDQSSSFSGVYPIGSGHSYIWEFSPVIAASVVDINGNRKHIVSDGISGLSDNSPEGSPWSFEPLSGFANPNQENLAMSDNPSSWPSSWPNRPEDWDGQWNGQYGQYVRADQESYFVVDDYYNSEFEFWPDTTDMPSSSTDSPDNHRRGLGIKMEARGYQWNHPAAEDIIIVTYWITNVGSNVLDSVVFGMYGDADVGGSSSFADDDAWFDTENDMVYQWDHDNWSTSYGGFRPAYFGWSFLESPGNPHDGIDNDEDGMIDESQFDGIDNDGDWDPDRDDIGSDGLAEFHINYPGPDEDGTEGNGIPDLGEPNFEITDNDESDQIGLTSFYSAPYPSVYPSNDEVMWSQLKPDVFQVPQQNVDQTFLYGSGYISLQPGEKKKFAIAMVYGENMADILRNTATMQNIYDNDYSFAKPPLKPTMTAVPGDNKVTLYWNDFSEKSMDPIYGRDFEGYRVYRSTDPGFIDSYTITDAYGNITFKEPIAIFDLEDGLRGPHPIGYNGVQFDMGEDSGLEYVYVDSNNVINGQTYYYSITAYDKGYDIDFFEKGYSPSENLQPIAPSECSVTLDLDYKGNVTSLSENAAIVVPNSEALGYVPPNTLDSGETFIRHISGYGSGLIDVDVVDPFAIEDGKEYHVVFDTLENAEELAFSIRDQELIVETLVINADSSAIASYDHIDARMTIILIDSTVYDTTYPLLVTDASGDIAYSYGTDYYLIPENGTFFISNSDLINSGEVTVSYRYFHLEKLETMDGETDNPIFDGMRVVVKDREYDLNEDLTRWIHGQDTILCNYDLIAMSVSRFYPADFELQFEGNIGDSVTVDPYGTKVPFRVKNVTHDDEPPFRISDFNGDGDWDPDESISIRPYAAVADGPLISIRFGHPTVAYETVIYDTTIVGYDTTFSEQTVITVDSLPDDQVIHPGIGDTFHIEIDRPFSMADVYGFTTTASRIDTAVTKNHLENIAVVPNPYVVAASWEPRHQYSSGRGPRKIDFINLPNECTIKIFTLSGYLVTTLHHNDVYENGSASWNLLSKDNLEISYGVYLYHIDAPGYGEHTGKFAVIK
ncbi:MAG: hypothetical protein ACJZ12_01300 [Candidatus Neomarinimicrobiota bacterium]